MHPSLTLPGAMPVPVSAAHPALVASFALEWLHSEQLAVPLLRYNQAHTLMLTEQGVMRVPVAAHILRELQALSVDAPNSISLALPRDGLQPCLEAVLPTDAAIGTLLDPLPQACDGKQVA